MGKMGGGGGDLPTGGSGIPRDVPRISPALKRSQFPGPFNPYTYGYNPRVHGPFDPQRFYGEGKPVCWWNVKLKDMPLRIFVANRSLDNVVPTFNRWLNKMMAKWVRPKNAFPMLPFYGAMIVFYMFNSRYKMLWHNNAVHHW